MSTEAPKILFKFYRVLKQQKCCLHTLSTEAPTTLLWNIWVLTHQQHCLKLPEYWCTNCIVLCYRVLNYHRHCFKLIEYWRTNNVWSYLSTGAPKIVFYFTEYPSINNIVFVYLSSGPSTTFLLAHHKYCFI